MGKTDYEHRKYLNRIDWQKEKNGECTITGDENRDIKKRNKERKRQLERHHNIEIELSR